MLCWRDADMSRAGGNVCFRVTAPRNGIWLRDCSVWLSRPSHLLCTVPRGCRMLGHCFPDVLQCAFSIFWFLHMLILYSFANWNIFFLFLINSLPPRLWWNLIYFSSSALRGQDTPSPLGGRWNTVWIKCWSLIWLVPASSSLHSCRRGLHRSLLFL